MTSGVRRPPALDDRLRRTAGTAVVLCSRGFSFERRLERVADYAKSNGVPTILLLHCPERRYSVPLAAEIVHRTEAAFERINDRYREWEEPELAFELILRKGTLEENLERLLRENEHDIAAVFTGKKMLDYRVESVKRFPVPFCFLD